MLFCLTPKPHAFQERLNWMSNSKVYPKFKVSRISRTAEKIPYQVRYYVFDKRVNGENSTKK